MDATEITTYLLSEGYDKTIIANLGKFSRLAAVEFYRSKLLGKTAEFGRHEKIENWEHDRACAYALEQLNPISRICALSRYKPSDRWIVWQLDSAYAAYIDGKKYSLPETIAAKPNSRQHVALYKEDAPINTASKIKRAGGSFISLQLRNEGIA